LPPWNPFEKVNSVKSSQQFYIFLALVLLMATVACAPVKTLDVWKDKTYNQRLQKTMVIAVTQEEYLRKQFENVLSDQLRDKGIEAIPSYKVLPQKTAELDREAVLEKVRALGIKNVLLARSIAKKEITNHQFGGPFFAPTAVYQDGWYSWYSGFVVYPEREFDTDYFTVSINLFALGNNQPVWSYLSQVKVSGSRQEAVNKFVPILVAQLEADALL
jgi:hypothetical protein